MSRQRRYVAHLHVTLHALKPVQALFAGDNFLRYSGDAPEVQKLQLFAWNAAARGNDVHMNANPTQGQLLHQKYIQKKEELKDTTKVSILSKYGGEEYLEKAPKELLQGQTEEYVEYSRTGQVVKGKERAKTRSKYLEDGTCSLDSVPTDTLLMNYAVYVNNHTAIWGSWYDPATGSWGYACCHSSVHMSYCTGEDGIKAAQASSAKNLLESAESSTSMPPPPVPSDSVEERKKKAEELFSKKRLGEGELSLDRDRLQQALSEERKRKGRGDDDDNRSGKKKKGGLGQSYEVSEEELGKFICSHVSWASLTRDLQRHTG